MAKHCVHWYDHVLRREDGHVLRRILRFEVEGQAKTGGSSRTRKMQVTEGSTKVGLSRKQPV